MHKTIGIPLLVVGLITFVVWAVRAFLVARREGAAQPQPEPGPTEPARAAAEADAEVAESAAAPVEGPGVAAVDGPSTEAAEAAERPAEAPKPKLEEEDADAAPEPAAVAKPAIVMPVPKPKPKPVSPLAKEPKPEDQQKRLRAGLSKTRKGFVARLGRLFRGKKEIDDNLLAELEEVLFTADIGVKTSEKLFAAVKEALSRKDLKDADAVWAQVRAEAKAILDIEADPIAYAAHKPFVLLIIGVNGVGKTTTIGKLAAKLAATGKRCVLAAGDTFRAAAVEQLEVWGKRVDAPVIRGQKDGQDPSSVIFDAIKKAENDGYDVVIADTAGRLHTKANLMEELKKIRRVCAKAAEGAPHETILVLDATTGQNAIQQANLFKDSVDVSSVVLTKLDGTAKGGIILGICDELKLPVRYIGIGEQVEDLREFVSEDFVDALFANVDEVSV